MASTRYKFTRLLLALVSILGVSSTVMLLTDQPITEESAANIFDLNSSSIGSRAPASIDTVIPKETLLDLNCLESAQHYETAGLRFRLKGDACVQAGDQALTTQIRNKSNGYVATVFQATPTTFTTDFINLKEGPNEIDVRFEAGGTTVEKTLTVVRTPASTAKK